VRIEQPDLTRKTDVVQAKVTGVNILIRLEILKVSGGEKWAQK
jgi:hypothetical protein